MSRASAPLPCSPGATSPRAPGRDPAGDAEDLPRLRDVYRRASWSNEGDRPLLTEHPELLELADTAVLEGRTRVATAGGTVIGFATLAPAEGFAELEDLFVDPDWMGRGVGRALVDDAVAIARAGGCPMVEVDANLHALAFYIRAGFVDRGRVPLAHGYAHRMRRGAGPPG